jgi:hypothetical protein
MPEESKGLLQLEGHLDDPELAFAANIPDGESVGCLWLP